MKVNYDDSRLRQAADKVPGATHLLDGKPQLLASEYSRHPESYDAFSDVAERNKSGVRCLIVGLGNLSETIGYVAAYYGQRGTVDGLEITAVDLVEKSFFEELVANQETFYLGKKDSGEPVVPIVGQEAAFVFDEVRGEYVLGRELGEFVQKVVENGHFGVNVQNIDQIDIPEGRHDFVSCQNVLGYVHDLLKDVTLKKVVAKVAEGGVLAIKTDSCDTKLAKSIEKQGLPLVYWKDKEYISGLYEKPRRLGGRQVKGFFNWDSDEGRQRKAALPKKENVFGI